MQPQPPFSKRQSQESIEEFYVLRDGVPSGLGRFADRVGAAILLQSQPPRRLSGGACLAATTAGAFARYTDSARRGGLSEDAAKGSYSSLECD